MDIQTQPGRLMVRGSTGDERVLQQFAAPRITAQGVAQEWLEWARDEAGRWYSWTRRRDALIESASGQWFRPILVGAGENGISTLMSGSTQS
ncbi:MAG: hypothetical protein ABI411_00395 [Tahibacter sp.]